jgi:hypothetical protein
MGGGFLADRAFNDDAKLLILKPGRPAGQKNAYLK